MLDWFNGKNITINIYGEKKSLRLPKDLTQFLKEVSKQLQISPSDCQNNLIFKFNVDKKPYFIKDESDYSGFLKVVNDSKTNITVFIEFNEKTAEIIRQSLAFNEKNNKVEIKDTNLSLLTKNIAKHTKHKPEQLQHSQLPNKI